ncbi:asparagine synthase-related protein [Thermodesulfobacteriota bacterium]
MKRNAFHLFTDPSDGEAFILDRPKTILIFEGKNYGSSDLKGLFEPLLGRYEEDKDAGRLFDYLEGDFSLCLFDVQRALVFMGTDRFARGQIFWGSRRPVAFFTHPSLFFRSTSLKPTLDTFPLWDRFAIGAITPPETLYKGYFSNVTGEYVQIDLQGKTKRCVYWSPLRRLTSGGLKKTDNVSFLSTQVQECFSKKVSEEISPYRKLGVGLSGGMDSGAILGAARRHFSGDVIAVSLGPDGPRSPDLKKARVTAAFNEARHIEYYPVARDLDDFTGIMGRLSQPFRSATIFMNYQIAKRVKEYDGECVLWGYGADLVLGNAGYCRRLYNIEDDLWPSSFTNPIIMALRLLPQNRYVAGLLNRILLHASLDSSSLGEKYFRGCKKSRFYQEKRLFKKGFVEAGREEEILSRIDRILQDNNESIVDRLIEVDLKVIHVYNQVSCAHHSSRIAGLDSIITYYNRDYVEINLMASNKIRALDRWNKYLLREAFRPFVHKDIYGGKRGACIIRWDKIISGPFRDAVINYLTHSEVIGDIFEVKYLRRLKGMIKHPGLMLLNLLGLALWYDVNFNDVGPETPLSEIIDYRWQEQDRTY